jgi:hypothetical protein
MKACAGTVTGPRRILRASVTHSAGELEWAVVVEDDRERHLDMSWGNTLLRPHASHSLAMDVCLERRAQDDRSLESLIEAALGSG